MMTQQLPLYFDHNATAPATPEVIAVMGELHGLPLNPSSVHGFGRKARQIAEGARKQCGEALGCFPKEITFCASGTEANNTVIQAYAGKTVLVSHGEHASLLKPAANAERIPLNCDGTVRVEWLEERLSRGDVALVSVMLANNETGVIQPVQAIAALAHQHGAQVHTDATQAFGRIAFDFTTLGVDVMTVSLHKAGGPLGAALLITRQGLAMKPLLTGGGQEYGLRAGTENVVAIAGAGALCEHLPQALAHMRNVAAWREAMEAALGEVIIFSGPATRLPNTTCLSMPGVLSETQIMSFDLAGVAVSAGSACTSGKIEPSHVLQAMGIPAAMAQTALRLSAGWNTTAADYQRVTAVWQQTYQRITTQRQAA